MKHGLVLAFSLAALAAKALAFLHPPTKRASALQVQSIGNSYLASLEAGTVEQAASTTSSFASEVVPAPAVATELMEADDIEESNRDETPTMKSLLEKAKDAGIAGIVAYGLVQTVFWFVSVPVVLAGYYAVIGEFPDISNEGDMAKLGGGA